MNLATRMLSVISLALGFVFTPAFADDDSHESFRVLSAQWWQWATSIPVASNPVADTTGANCFVGQRGTIWFLAGTSNSKPVVRTCSVPEGAPLFFPVVNVINVNTPGVGGQVNQDKSVAVLRAEAAPYVDTANGLKVLLDNREIKAIRRVRSIVFAAVFPQPNLFGDTTLVPGRIYSPAIDDGFYVKLNGLPAGQHHLKIQGELPAFPASVDVDYILNVVKVTLKD